MDLNVKGFFIAFVKEKIGDVVLGRDLRLDTKNMIHKRKS